MTNTTPTTGSEDRPSKDMTHGLPELPLPKPTVQFRRRAWLAFQRAIDPLAPPRPLRPRRR